MAVWEMTPVARPDDPSWQGRRQFARVLVRAASPAEARVVASRLDTPDEAHEFGDQHPRYRSGLMDAALYVAHAAPGDAGFEADGPAEVLEAEPRESQEYT